MQTTYLRGNGEVLIDSGASNSVTPHKRLLHSYVEHVDYATDFHGDTVKYLGYGYLVINFDGYTINTKAYHLPSALSTIVTEYDLFDTGCDVHVISRSPVVKELIYKGHIIPLITKDRTHVFDESHLLSPTPTIKICSIHTRFAHVNARSLLDSISHGTITGVPDKEISGLKSLLSDHDCESCLLAKARRSNAVEGSPSKYLRDIPFSRVYTDVCQVTRSQHKDRPQYFVSFKCATTGFVKIYPIHSKEEVFKRINQYVNWVYTQFGAKVKSMFSDQGTEYLNKHVTDLLIDKGIELHYTSGYSPKSNGVAERLNLTIMNDVRSMLFNANLPSAFWPEAATYSVYLRNYIWSNSLGNSPAGKLGLTPFSFSHLHSFGEKVYVKVLPEGSKTDTRSEVGVYLGYNDETFGNKVFIPTDSTNLAYGRFEDTRHCSFTRSGSLFVDNHVNVNSRHSFDDFIDCNHTPTDIQPSQPVVLDDLIDSDLSPIAPSTNTPSSTSFLDANFEEGDSDVDLSYDDSHHPALSNDQKFPISEKDLVKDTAYLSAITTTIPKAPRKAATVAKRTMYQPTKDVVTHNSSGSGIVNPSDAETLVSEAKSSLSVVQPSSSTTVKETCPPSSQHGHSLSQFANAKFSFTVGSDRTSVPPANNNSVTPQDASGTADSKSKSQSKHASNSTSPKPSSSPKWSQLPTNGIASRVKRRRGPTSSDPNSIKRVHIRLLNIPSVNALVIPHNVPNTFQQALRSPDRSQWKEAIDAELNSHLTMNTWSTTPLITDDPTILKSSISTRWVFALKSDGRYKGRLVARGDRQSPSTYSEVYSPTLRAEIARSIFSTSVSNNWFLSQFDFTTAYLNSKLDTDVYIYPPEGFTGHHGLNIPSGKRVVYKLNRGLYGLKQAGRLWHETLSNSLSELGYSKSSAFPSTFTKLDEKGNTIATLGIFVDDMILTTKFKEDIDNTIDKLMDKYLLKEIQSGADGYNKFLGVDVKFIRNKEGRMDEIILTQKKYIEEYVSDNDINITKVYNTPLPPNFYFDKIEKSSPLYASDKALKTAQTNYRSAIGTLLYMSIMTRPDITYAVNYLARFADYPHPVLIDMVKRVICYSYSTSNFALHYKRSDDTPITCYTDSDYAQDVITRKSMNGFLIYHYGNLVHWKSKYTPLVCTSSDQAEQQAIYMATNELDWFRPLLQFIGAINNDAKIQLFVDNKTAILAMTTDNFGTASKAYAVRTQKLKERFQTGIYIVDHISGELQLADVLTKPITVQVHKKLIPRIMEIA
jgi:hypothetical protein